MDLGRFELCLNVRNLAVSQAFYEALGFRKVSGEAENGWLVLKSESLSLGLYQGHVGENLLNFRGSDVFALASQIQRAGFAFETPAETEPDGSAGAKLRDPDGNLIYLNTMPGEA